MSYNNEAILPVVVDLETVSHDAASDYLEPASAPANYKDEAKIAAYIAEAKQKALDRAALDLDLCRIVALGFHLGFTDAPPSVFLGQDEHEEARAMELFWSTVADRPLLGFNILQFDLPVLIRRSQLLGVLTPPLQLGRYKHPSVIDLMQVLSFDGLVQPRGLQFYARRFDLVTDPDPHTGADIARLVAAGDWDAVTDHCRRDVATTRALARRIGLLPAAAETTAVDGRAA